MGRVVERIGVVCEDDGVMKVEIFILLNVLLLVDGDQFLSKYRECCVLVRR